MSLIPLNTLIEDEQFNSLIWTLFHTISVKIKNDISALDMRNLIDIIIIPICESHPCSICQEHSSIYLQEHNYFRNIVNKNNLISNLFDFHNEVNQRLEKQIFEINMIDSYKEYNIKDIINGIRIIVEKDNNDNELFLSKIMDIQNFFENNLHLFETISDIRKE